MNYFQKKVLLFGLLADLGMVASVGCGKDDNSYTFKVSGTDSKIVWSNDDSVCGSISYADIEGRIKIVVLEQNGVVKPYFMLKDFYYALGKGSSYTYLSYVDLHSGTTMMYSKWSGSYSNEQDARGLEPMSTIGQNITIVEELEFFDYLIQYGKIQREYDINELITFYDEEIEPSLEASLSEKSKSMK